MIEFLKDIFILLLSALVAIGFLVAVVWFYLLMAKIAIEVVDE